MKMTSLDETALRWAGRALSVDSSPHGVTPLGAASLAEVPRSIVVLLETIGWVISDLEADPEGRGPRRMVLSHHSGLWLLASVDRLNRCTVERFRRFKALGHSGGCVPMNVQIEDVFLGRDRLPSREALAERLAHYVIDNAGEDRLAHLHDWKSWGHAIFRTHLGIPEKPVGH